METLPQFAQAASRINASAIRRVFDLAAQKKDPINLSIGQPDFPVPEAVKEAFIQAIQENKTAYTQTQGLLSLRQKLADKLGQENNLMGWEQNELTADNILVSSGVSSLLYLLFAVLVDPGDEILLVDPYFLIYEALAGYFQAKATYIDQDNLIEELEQKAHDRVKFILFSSPSNPTGHIFGAETLKKAATILDRHGIWAISDEIYEKFDYENCHFSIGSHYPNTITLNGFSKSFAMTGLRLGYAAAPQKILNQMATIQQYTFVCAPHPSQIAGELVMEVDLNHYVREYQKRRDYMFEELKEHFELAKPGGAFYLFPRLKNTKQKITAERFAELAIDKDVLIVPGHIFSQREGGFRISYATSMEKLKLGSARLQELAQELV